MEETVDLIRYWHRQRMFAMEQRKRLDLALGSFLRLQLGWSRDLKKPDSDRIKKQVSDLIKIGEAEFKGKPNEIDEPVYTEWSAVILAAITARHPFDSIEKQAEKELKALARRLPVWDFFCEGIRGFGELSLATIVGEAGDLSNYPRKGHLWKRMGVAVIDGNRQGAPGKNASKEDWTEHGYNPKRRSHMWNIGQALVKANGDGKYRDVYLTRKAVERQKAEAKGLTVAAAASIPQTNKDDYMSLGHIDRRAQRYMEKMLLRDLLSAWKQTDVNYDAAPLLRDAA